MVKNDELKEKINKIPLSKPVKNKDNFDTFLGQGTNPQAFQKAKISLHQNDDRSKTQSVLSMCNIKKTIYTSLISRPTSSVVKHKSKANQPNKSLVKTLSTTLKKNGQMI